VVEGGPTFTHIITLGAIWLTLGTTVAMAIHRSASCRLDRHGHRIDKLVDSINALTVQVTKQNGRIGSLETCTKRLEDRPENK